MFGIQRSRRRVLAGVAGGVAERFGIHPALLRGAWFVSIPMTMGISAVAYGLLALVLPAARDGDVWRPSPAFLPQAFALFVLAHGAIHVMGFLPAWNLPAPAGFEHTTTFLFGRLELGETGTRILGIAWLAITVAYVRVAVLLWRGHRHAAVATALVSVASGIVCAIMLPLAQAGLVIDVALVAVLLLTPRFVIARRASRVAPAGHLSGV